MIFKYFNRVFSHGNNFNSFLDTLYVQNTGIVVIKETDKLSKSLWAIEVAKQDENSLKFYL